MNTRTRPTDPSSPLWAARLGDVTLALLRNRHALRRTARRAGDQRLAQRLRRFARRKQAAVEDLSRINPDVATDMPDGPVSAVRSLESEARKAFETSAFASAIAANRRLRVALERALETKSPDRVRLRLENLRRQADSEAAVLNQRLSELTQIDPDTATT